MEETDARACEHNAPREDVVDRFVVKEALPGALACLLATLLLVGCAVLGEPTEETEITETEAQEAATSAETPTERPNILFILTDDLDYASAQKMPRIGALLREGGASFENAFASQSLCCPSRATILTGLYAHNSGIKGNRPPDGGFEVFRDEGLEEETIATRLQEGGYRTAFFGKYLNGYPAPGDPSYVPAGWDEWYGELERYEPYDYKINENGEVVSYGSEEEDFFTDVLSDKATDFVGQAAPEDRPFFAYVNPTAPHEPAIPAERHRGAFAAEKAPRSPSFDEEDVSDKPSWIRDGERFSEEDVSETDERYRRRLESMLAVDEMVASLVEELEAVGELDNTYIFFTSDNGFLQGEHRLYNIKDRPYEESARIPFFVRGPGIASGTEVEELALNTDFAPTFAGLAGISFPADGRSFLPLLRGEEPSAWRSAVLLEGFVGRGARVYAAVRTEDYKYVEYGNGEEELYDLSADPYELENIYDSVDPTLIEDLETRLEALRDCSGDECREAEDAS
jgi:arylsulfatase A-like enzyme